MQFSGFRSVIGSMWSVDDKVARRVVSAFYCNLIQVNGFGEIRLHARCSSAAQGFEVVGQQDSVRTADCIVHIVC
ncbi:uncharacterized protein BJ212DRAFT_1412407, partial [Suillus subaureus]